MTAPAIRPVAAAREPIPAASCFDDVTAEHVRSVPLRWQARTAWAMVAVVLILHVVAAALAPSWAARWRAVIDIAPVHAIVGALIVARRGNLVGWLLVVAGGSIGLSQAATMYAHRALVAQPGALPAGEWAAWISSWAWVPGFTAAVLLLPLWFPDGRPPSTRWRPLAWLLAGLALLQLPIQALRSGPLLVADPVTSLDVPIAGNPVGIAALAPLSTIVDAVIGIAFFPALIALIAAVVVRYRRAGGHERYQLRWFLFAVALQPVAFAISTVLSAFALEHSILPVVSDALALAVPVAIGVAVLRYRLYEIDRIVSRTVTYAMVSAPLAAVYALVAVLPSAVFDFESDLLVAAATLAVAGLFVPVRRWVRAVVDRRFNRARYDAQQVVERFGDRLRGDLQLDGLADDLRRVVATTVQPSHVTLWLRTPEPIP